MKIETDLPHAVLECPQFNAGLERPSVSDSDDDARHGVQIAAVAGIRKLISSLTLGPDLTIRDLIEEGRRF